MTALKFRPLSPTDDAALAALFAAGGTDRTIATALGTSEGGIASARKRLGLSRYRKQWDAEKDALVRAEYPRCPNKRLLAARLGCSPTHLRGRAAALGVRDELHYEVAQQREAARLIGRDPAPPLPDREESRLNRARQIVMALAGRRLTLKQLAREGWSVPYVVSVTRESPEMLTCDGLFVSAREA